MGRAVRPKPKRLGEKLLQIRNALGLSQSDMVRRLGYEDVLWYTQISAYELNNNEPPLPTLLQYARIAGVYIDDLVDDELDLPDKLPGTVKHEGIKHKPTSRARKR
jgi:transcriptional regulator with XRE-family HTH domain